MCTIVNCNQIIFHSSWDQNLESLLTLSGDLSAKSLTSILSCHLGVLKQHAELALILRGLQKENYQIKNNQRPSLIARLKKYAAYL